MDFYGDDEDEIIPAAPSHSSDRETLLKFVAAIFALVASILGLVGKFPWVLNRWVLDGVIVLGVGVLAWLARPRVARWRQKINRRKREQEFIEKNAAQLHASVDQFREFISDTNQKSFRCIVKSALSQRATDVERVFGGDYLGKWFACFCQELKFPALSAVALLARYREFTVIVQQFNFDYIIRTQKLFTSDAMPQPEHVLEALEAFREDYNAFLRNLEAWQKTIMSYLKSIGVTDFSTQWQLAPAISFDRPASFKNSQAVK